MNSTTLMPGDVASAAYCEDRPRSGGGGVIEVGAPGCDHKELDLSFAAGTFGVGDSITLSLTLTHTHNDDYYFGLDRPIEGARVGLIYEAGLSTVGVAVSQDSIFDSRRVTGLMASTAAPTPLGEQLPAGYVLPPFAVDLDPVLTPVPEPASIALMAAGWLGVLAAARRRRSAPSGPSR